MRLNCCCFTCIVGQDETEKEEETDRLLEEDDKDESQSQNLHSKASSYSRSVSGVSTSSTVRGFSTESNDQASETVESSGAAKEKFSKAVGVLKKYNVMSSKYNTKDLQRQLSSPPKLRLKVGIKILQRSNVAKISVLEAHDVGETLQRKDYPETGSSTDGEPSVVVQVRTKIMSSDVRGHTRKHEIQGGITGALKFKNEPIHTIDLDEFLQCQIRFRLYYVLKHQRDKLLGEYVLDIAGLELDRDYAVTHTIFEMYDPSSDASGLQSMKPVVQRILSMTESQASLDKSTPKIQRQSKIRSQDSEARLNVKVESEKILEDPQTSEDGSHSPKTPFSKAFKSIRHGASNMLSKESGNKESSRSLSSESETILPSTEHLSANEKLKLAVKERSEKVEELEETTAAMANTASNFTALSIKLKEKYKIESGKKSKSSES